MAQRKQHRGLIDCAHIYLPLALYGDIISRALSRAAQLYLVTASSTFAATQP